MPRIIQTVVDILPRSIKNSDQDVLALCNVFDKMGLLQLEKYEHLCHFVQNYAASRFEFMEKHVALEFGEFLFKIGLWQWDQNFMS